MLAANKTIDTGNRFDSISNSAFAEKDRTDPGMRVNVSQRRWVQRGQSLEAAKTFEERRQERPSQIGLKTGLRNDIIGEKILERKL